MQSLGITLVVMVVAAGQEAPSKADPTPQDVRAAIERSLPFLAEGGTWPGRRPRAAPPATTSR